MSDSFTGLIKITGIVFLLLGIWGLLAFWVPESFLVSGNLENLMRRTALYGILGIGVAFVIISSGIDLSIGSLVCLSACLLALFLRVDYVEWGSQSVWSVDAESNSIRLSSDHGFQIGDSLWFDADRRNRGLVIVQRVQPDDDRQSTLMVQGPLNRSREAQDQQPVAKVSQCFKFEVTDADQVRLSTSGDRPLRLRGGDRIAFVHPEKSRRERTIESVSPDQTLVLASGGEIDDSFFALPIRRSPLMPIPVAVLLVALVSLLIGLIHGLLITRLNLQPFVVTLCGLMIYRGISRWLTADQTVGFNEYSETLAAVGTGRWILWSSEKGEFGIPYSFLIFIWVVIAAVVLLNLTVWGRHLIALGKNPEAARYSGVDTKKVTLASYLLCSLLAGIGGMMFAIDSLSIAPSSFGNFFELYAIAAAVLGGCSLRGGEGSILGVVVGTALMQTLYNAIILLKIPDTLEFSIIGGVILMGVIADELLHRARQR